MPPKPHVHDTDADTYAGWLTVVVKTIACLTIALAFTETLWRSLGYLPAKSDMMHFARLRRAADGDRNAVALLGSSRVRYGLDPQSLNRVLPAYRFLQLGILGNSALPVLGDLARDPNFAGLVICELNPAQWAGSSPDSKLPEALAYTHPVMSGAYLESLLAEQVREGASFFSYDLFTEAPRIFQRKPIPQPEQPDRFVRFVDAGPATDEHLIQSWEIAARQSGERIKHASSLPVTQKVQEWVERIRRRGGDVAFVRMPVDGRLRALEDAVFPQTQSLIREVRAHSLLVMDFAEMPGHFRCPDGSHLEASEATRFSSLLAEKLAAKGFFR